MRKFIVEALGTFILLLAYGLTNDPLAIGLTLCALIYFGIFISGAHFNPAISFAYLIRRDITYSDFIGYVTSQLLGAFAASGTLLMLSGMVFYVEPPTTSNLYQQATIEIIFTFVLAIVYLSLINNKRGDLVRMNGLGVGLTLTGCIVLGKSISGAVYNPAISISSSIIDFMTVRGSSYEHILLFTIAPLAGAALAALMSWYVND